MTPIEDKTRAQIATFLPDAIATALNSYQQFLEQDAGNDAKGFKAHHDACKVAIAHLELLIKLAQWADIPPTEQADAIQAQIMSDMLARAQKEIDESGANKEK